MISNLHLGFLPDVILVYCILHNIILGQSPEEGEDFLNVLRCEGLDNTEENVVLADQHPVAEDDRVDENPAETTRQKRHAFHVYLTTRRRGAHRQA